LDLKVEPSLNSRFPGISARIIRVKGVSVRGEDARLEDFKAEIIKRVKDRWTLDQLREHPTFRAYRDFFWRVGVDPTKTRPAAEALIRRLLHGRPLPKVNTLVDSYNIASVDTAVALAAFDEDELIGELLLREAKTDEKLLGIGMEKPITLKGGEVLVTDAEKIIAIYPYRDADACKISNDTTRVTLLVCGVPNIKDETLDYASYIVVKYVTMFCGGSEA
jgi:DNA/RNA-binding domain of Phe-tRNA-synthetase-like protein